MEPGIDTVIVPAHKRRKRKGKLDEDLSDFPVKVIEHTMTEKELNDCFPEGYGRLPDEVYRKLELIPAVFEVHEHHIAVYRGKNGKIVRAERPKEMLDASIATPSLVSAIINGKYTNAVPLYRQEQEFSRNDVNISRQTMCGAKQAAVHEYQKTRKADAAGEFLKGFEGTLVCDGYQVYHTLEDREDTKFEAAGCWTHARRPFAQVVKSLGEKQVAGTVAMEALMQVQTIYHTDNQLQKLPPSERKKRRRLLVKPLVDSFFKWCREKEGKVAPSSETAKGIQYCLNQEKYLRVFLTNPQIPLDNNLAEQAIRPFCVGKKNWKMIDTVHGAQASAMLHRIVETAKANELNIYQYFKHLLTEIPKHMDGTSLDFLDDLLPWSKALPEICRKKKTSESK